MIELYIILILMIIAAIASIYIEDLLSSVIALGAVGFGITLAFLFLKAPDLAITQLVVEILSLIILIKATIKSNRDINKEKNYISYIFLASFFIIAFLYFGYKAISELPKFGFPIAKVSSFYIREGLNKTKAVNLVSSIILDFRAYDTLGEAIVLFTSVVGVLSVLRRNNEK